MNPTLITGILQLIAEVLPNITSSAAVGKVLNILIQIVPVVVQEFEDVLPEVKAIIASLSANPATMKAQLDQLAVIDAQVDAAFDAAAKAAQKADAAPGSTA